MPTAAQKRRQVHVTARGGTPEPDHRPPSIQRQNVTDASGRLLRPALVEAGEWRDPEDNEALTRGADGRRGQRTVRGYRVVDPLLHLHRRNPTEVTAEHVRAAARLRNDYETANGAQCTAAELRITSGAAGGKNPADVQLDAIARLRGAIQAVGPSLYGVLAPVVIHGWTVGRLAEARGSSAHRVTGYLVAALDRLADHYWPDRGPATVVPERMAFDPTVTDIPPRRIGRWREVQQFD